MQIAAAGLAEQLLPSLKAATPEVVERAGERTPSLRRYLIGMASPKVQTTLCSGDIAAWDLDRLCAVSASLDYRVEALLVPAGMKAVVSFKPA